MYWQHVIGTVCVLAACHRYIATMINPVLAKFNPQEDHVICQWPHIYMHISKRGGIELTRRLLSRNNNLS